MAIHARTTRAAGALALCGALLVLWGCVDRLLVEPAQPTTASLTFAANIVSAAAVEPGPGWTAAYDAADQVRIEIRRDGVVFQEETLAFTPDQTGARVQLEVELSADEEPLALTFALRRGEDVLFRGDTTVIARAGAQSEAALSLVPVAAAVQAEVPTSPPALGDTTVLRAVALFATADTITTAMQWSVMDPDVLELLADGRIHAIGVGLGRVLAAYGERADTIEVTVGAPTLVRVCGDAADARTFARLDAGLAAVAAGGTVRLCDGTHTVQDVRIDRAVTIEAEGPGEPVLDAAGAYAALNVGDVADGAVVIRGLRFRGAAFTGIHIVGAYDTVLFDDCAFEVPTEAVEPGARGYAAGVFAYQATGSGITVQNSVFTGGDIGVHTNQAPYVFVLKNVFTGQANAAIHGTFRRIEGNTIDGCTRGEWCIFADSLWGDHTEPHEIIGNTITVDLDKGQQVEFPITIHHLPNVVVRDNVIRGLGGTRTADDWTTWPMRSGLLFMTPDGEIAGNTVDGAYDGLSFSGNVEARDNIIRNTLNAIHFRTWDDITQTRAHANDIENYVYAFAGAPAGSLTCNWWGSADGPATDADPAIYSPYETTPIAGTGRACADATAPSPLTFAAIEPAAGSAGTTVPVTLRGSGFGSDGISVSASGTGITIINIAVVDDTTVTADFDIAAGATSGAYDVIVTRSNLPDATIDTAGPLPFTVDPPVLAATSPLTFAAIEPAAGTAGTTVPVTLRGSGFGSDSISVSASGTGITIINIAVVDDTTVTADFDIAGGATSGAYDVIVTRSNLADATVDTAGPLPFTVDPAVPTLTSLTPASGTAGSTTRVTLAGTGFTANLAVAISGTGVALTMVGTATDTTATVDFQILTDAATGARDVTVTTEGGTSAPQTFMVEAPVPASVTVTPATLDLYAGSTGTLAATVQDASGSELTGQPITWATSDSAVATVDQNGVVTAVATGTALVSATSGGVSDTATVTAFTYRLGYNYETQTLGVGQYMHGCCGVPLTKISIPAAIAQDVTISFTHTDSARVTTPASVTIPAGATQADVSVVGAAVGVDTIIASASLPDYAPDTLVVTVGNGYVDPYQWPNPASLQVGQTASGITLLLRAPDGGSQVRVAAATAFTLTPPANFEYVDGAGNVITSVTFQAGTYQSDAFGIRGVAEGSGAGTITQADYQTLTPPTTTVTAAQVAFNYEAQTLGVGQYMHGCCGVPLTSVSIPAALAEDLTVTLTHTDSSRVTTPASVTIPAGQTSVDVSVVGAAVGTDSIFTSASLPGYAPDTLVVTIGNGYVDTYQWTSSLQVGQTSASAATLLLRAPDGGSQVRVAELTTFTITPPASYEFVDGAGNVITSIAFQAGTYQSDPFWLRGVAEGEGTATIAHADYQTVTSPSTTVEPAQAAFNYEAQTLGVGQYMHGCCGVPLTKVSIPAALAEDLTVTLTHTDAAKVTTPASVTIPAGLTSVDVSVVGAAVGTDSIFTSASLPGYASDTLVVTVGNGYVDTYQWTTSLRVGETSSSATLLLRAPDGGGQVRVAELTTFTLTPPANFVFVDSAGNTITSIAFQAGTYQSDPFWIKGVAEGDGAATISSPDYQTVTSPSTTVF